MAQMRCCPVEESWCSYWCSYEGVDSSPEVGRQQEEEAAYLRRNNCSHIYDKLVTSFAAAAGGAASNHIFDVVLLAQHCRAV